LGLKKNESSGELMAAIRQLKAERNAVILAHNYQTEAIQQLADYVGDSLGLCYQAAKTEAEVILFCGVHFMAESAKVINPGKRVLIPDMNAGCSLSDACPAEQLAAYKAQNPDTVIVAYVNCSAAVKALCDITCTSGNAIRVVQSIPEDKKILFVPDQNLGQWVVQKTGRSLELWPGSCYVHVLFSLRAIEALCLKHPDAPIVAHPECLQAVRDRADHMCSTEQMVQFCKQHPSGTFIIVTESGMLHRLRREIPDKTFVAGPTSRCACNDCKYMKMNTLEKMYQALLNMSPEIHLPQDILVRAKIPLERMLALG
jgi:quinolinate synthase